MEEYVFVYVKKEPRENFVELFDVTLYPCHIGKMTLSESQDLCVQLKTLAIRKGFIDRGHFDIPEDDLHSAISWGRLSSIAVLSEQVFLEKWDGEQLTLIRTDNELQNRRNDKAGFLKDDPYYLLNEAVEYAIALRELRSTTQDKELEPSPESNDNSGMEWTDFNDTQQGKRKSDPEKDAEAQRIRRDRILGTMVHVLMKIENTNKTDAVCRVKQAIESIKENPNGGIAPKFTKEYLLESCFEPVSDIDKYTDYKVFSPNELPQKRKDKGPIIEMLKAAVIIVQCCLPREKFSSQKVKEAFVKTAYNNSADLKDELGFEKGA